MEQISVRAYGKINLVLNITKKRADGYHDLESVFQRISLYDELTLVKTPTGDIELDCPLEDVALEDNIVTKAFRALQAVFPQQCGGVMVKLKKNIPSQAGLAGGSADCAAFLLAYCQLYNLSIAREELVKLGARLGADVPVCLHYGVMLAHGIGEIITPITQKMELALVIIKPEVSFPTPKMYRRLDEKLGQFQSLPYCDALVQKGLEQNNLDQVCANLYNIFEEAVEDDSIAKVKEALLSSGAQAALMSGSGSAVFGVYNNMAEAEKAYDSLKDRYEAYLCTEMKERGMYL